MDFFWILLVSSAGIKGLIAGSYVSKRHEEHNVCCRVFDPAGYADFRDSSLKEAAMAFASSGSAAAVRKLLQRHPFTLMPHVLDILSCFPETLPPKIYIDILPKACS